MPAPRGEAICRIIPALFLLCVTPACVTLEIPVTPPQFQAVDFFSASREGIEIRAKPIEGMDNYLELFDDNLPEIGIAAVWATVRNLRDEDISFEHARWDLRAAGNNYSELTISQVFGHYYKRRGVRLYSQYADQRERADLDRLILKDGQIRPGQERAGFLFFNIPSVPSAGWARTTMLRVRDIRFPRHRKADITVSLSYANP